MRPGVSVVADKAFLRRLRSPTRYVNGRAWRSDPAAGSLRARVRKLRAGLEAMQGADVHRLALTQPVASGRHVVIGDDAHLGRAWSGRPGAVRGHLIDIHLGGTL